MKRAVTPLVSTMILVVIGVALGVLVGLFIVRFQETVTPTIEISIIDATSKSSNTYTAITVYIVCVKGGGKIRVTDISIDADGTTYTPVRCYSCNVWYAIGEGDVIPITFVTNRIDADSGVVKIVVDRDPGGETTIVEKISLS